MTILRTELQDMINKIVAIHGEEGVCRTAAEWADIMSLPEDQPINILNLLKYKKVVQTDSGEIPGWKAYNEYMTGVGAAFARVGGKRLFFGKVNHIFPSTDKQNWDAVILTTYPTPVALATYWLDEEFIAGHKHRVDGIERGQVIVLKAL